ncbi:unnamed protein product, partial [Porites lobata]
TLVNLSETLATKFTTANDDDALVDALTSSELVNEVGQAAHSIKAFDAAHHDNPSFCYWRQYMKLLEALLELQGQTWLEIAGVLPTMSAPSCQKTPKRCLTS